MITNNIRYSILLFLAIFYTFNSLITLYLPLFGARLYGVDVQKAPTSSSSTTSKQYGKPETAFTRAFAGRNLAISLTFLAFAKQRMFRAAGLLMGCLAVSAAIDTALVYTAGTEGKTWTHAVGCGVLLVLSALFVAP